MTILKDRPAAPAEKELADLQRRHVDLCGQLDTERGKAAQVEADLLTGKAEICDVTTARQRCAALQDAVHSLQGQIDARAGECTAQWRVDETGRTLAEIGESRRVLEARRVRCGELHDEGVEALRTIVDKMAEESAAYTQERRQLAALLARLRELRTATGSDAGEAVETAMEVPAARAFSPRAGFVADQLSAGVCRAFDAAVKQRVSAARGATMAEGPQSCAPGGIGDPWAEAKGIGGRRG